MITFPYNRSLWVPFLWSIWADCQHAHGWAQCQQQCILWVHTKGERWQHRAYFLVDTSCRGVLSGFFNSRSLPVLPTAHCSLEADLELLYQQLGSRLCPWQGCDNRRAKRRPQPIPREGLDHHNINYIPYPGDKGQQTPKKDVVGIHSKIGLCTKNTRFTQATHGHCHIETVSDSHWFPVAKCLIGGVSWFFRHHRASKSGLHCSFKKVYSLPSLPVIVSKCVCPALQHRGPCFSAIPPTQTPRLPGSEYLSYHESKSLKTSREEDISLSIHL